ncbi:hypothetical protein HPP92_001173 [Vanilla planifolia]|uniref:SANT domain-containing protein n=1 Tax=Vanilla planifolia TaxID=51239 RepID=A0A835VLL4_VANPL|nr:hypothetical protein HPP92_001173 [Vanilla planifolia]
MVNKLNIGLANCMLRSSVLDGRVINVHLSYNDRVDDVQMEVDEENDILTIMEAMHRHCANWFYFVDNQMDAPTHETDGHGAEAPVDHFCNSGSSETIDIYDEDVLLPRIGDQYQVKIPAMKKYSKHRLRSIPKGQMPSHMASPGIGLAIPVMWVCCAIDKSSVQKEKGELQRNGAFGKSIVPMNLPIGSNASDLEGRTQNRHMLNNSYDCIFPHSSGFNIDSSDLLKRAEGVAKRANCGSIDTSPQIKKPISGYYPLPGSPSCFWTAAERQSFLLGLYIFGKNLNKVKIFMELKRMGDILSFYYGEFFRSNAYRRWSESRKRRSKRCIHGHRIFTGWRQQEFLSRVLPTVNKEVQPTLLEKPLGLARKLDLTEVVVDPSKRTQSIPLRPEIPIGKACSSLTCGNIIKFLTGDFRLSKARSNDLFWEAVWPRLLANGWHSEQPKNLRSFRSKNTLVFLVPGVKKFSRKKLVKGSHYFDSISDVLSKVASDPRLLNLDGEGDKGRCFSQAMDWDADRKLEQDGSSTNRRHGYLLPRIPYCNSELMKFTVVDTSLAQGEGPFKARQLRSLPLDSTSSYCPAFQDPGNVSSSETEDCTDTSDDDEYSNSKSFEDGKAEVVVHHTSFPLPDVSMNGESNLKSEQNQTVKYDRTNRSLSASKCRNLTTCSSRGNNSRSNSYPRTASPTPVPVANPSLNEIKVDKQQEENCFDLNNLPSDAEVAGPSGVELTETCESVHTEPVQASTDLTSDQHPPTGNRRHSIRNRPPTARALEALASGFLGTKRTWRSSSSTSRPSRKARKTSMEQAQACPGIAVSNSFDSSVDEVVGRHQKESLRKDTPELLGVP